MVRTAVAVADEEVVDAAVVVVAAAKVAAVEVAAAATKKGLRTPQGINPLSSGALDVKWRAITLVCMQAVVVLQ